MNFLAHLYLSGDDPEVLVGNLLGDFVKGRLSGNFPDGIERGIELHRRIDSFSGRSRHFIRSKRRLDESFGHYRGVLVDLFYDHFLAAHWDDYTDVPFQRFLADARQIAEEYAEVLPERMRLALPVIFAELLPSYREIEGIARALQRMSIRITRPNRLGEGAIELRRHYNWLYDDFREFLPELRGFVNGKA
jgi:acyl carrier protein phosphodiesterase